MRELKFRAWDKIKEEWIYSDTSPAMWRYFKELEERGIRHFESYEYTGLFDKQGKEIYEGDIYQQEWKDERVTGEIIYGDMARFWLKPFEHYFIGEIKNTGEVIGNIYENPELVGEIK